MVNKRNILLIGRTGNGKSTLANVLVGANKFKESGGIISKTKKVQVEEFESKGIVYRVIDTNGIGDTNLSQEVVLSNLKEASHFIRDGLNQIIFVTRNRFTDEEIEAYDLLSTTIFDDNIWEFTTIVRAGFSSFRSPDRCEEDKQEAISIGGKLANIINNCNELIHVNNLTEEEEPGLTSRAESRNKILQHLEKCRKSYKPEFLIEFCKTIDEFYSFVEEINQGINVNISALNNNVESIKNFVSECKELIKKVKEQKEKLVDRMDSRTTTSNIGNASIVGSVVLYGIGTAAFPPLVVPATFGVVGGALTSTIGDITGGIDENNFYKSFLRRLEENESNFKKLLKSLKELVDFKVIASRFEDLEYKKSEMNKEKVKIVEQVINRILEEDKIPNTVIANKKEKELNYSGVWAAGGVIAEGTAKLLLPVAPTCVYSLIRDNKKNRIESLSSVSDMEKVIESLNNDLEENEEIINSLRQKIEKYEDCQKEVLKLLSDK